MHPEEQPVAESAARLRAEFGDAPETAIVLGSGLGAVVERIRDAKVVDTADLAFPPSTVVGHAGRAVRGTLGGRSVIAFSGRVHLYEGHSAQVIVRPIRALKAWGVKRVILTASVGGITEGLEPGEVVVIRDHINFQRDNPLIGPTYGEVRFPDLTKAYSPSIRKAIHTVALELNQRLHDGVYGAMTGPAYETPAEITMLRTVGADVVGMSTVPEIIAAAQVGLPAAAIAVVSNRAAGLSLSPLTHDEVTETANVVAKRLADLFEALLPRLDET